MSRFRELREGVPRFEVMSATPEDAKEIARIQHESWIATYPNTDAGISQQTIEKRLGDVGKRTEFWQKTLEHLPDNVHVVTVKENDKIIGFCKVAKNELENHVDALYLDPTHKKRGAGGFVFESAIEWLGTDKPISLEVVSYNLDSIGFYKRYGFEPSGQTGSIDLRNGQSMPILVMRRPAD